MGASTEEFGAGQFQALEGIAEKSLFFFFFFKEKSLFEGADDEESFIFADKGSQTKGPITA